MLRFGHRHTRGSRSTTTPSLGQRTKTKLVRLPFSAPFISSLIRGRHSITNFSNLAVVALNGVSMPSQDVKWKQIYVLACSVPFAVPPSSPSFLSHFIILSLHFIYLPFLKVNRLQEAFPSAFISGAIASSNRGSAAIVFSYALALEALFLHSFCPFIT